MERHRVALHHFQKLYDELAPKQQERIDSLVYIHNIKYFYKDIKTLPVASQ